MKKILLLLCLAAGMVAGAQKDMPKGFVNGNFVVNNNAVTWQKVYASELTFKDISTNLKISGLAEKPDVEEAMIYGGMTPFLIDYKAAGGSALGSKPYITNMKYNAFFVIKQTDTGYVVVLKKITTAMEADVKSLGVDLTGTTWGLEEWAITKKGEWKPTFIGKPAYTLDFAFNKMFEGLFR